MQLSGVQQQTQPQVQPQAQPQVQQQGKQPYPATKEEAMKFSNDILQVLYDEKIYGNTVKQLEQVNDVDKGRGVGLIAGHIVGDRVADVRGQTGRKIKMGLVVGALQATISSVAGIAKENQIFEMGKEEMKTALKTAVDMLDGAGSKKPQQPAQQQPQQQPVQGVA